MCPPSVAMFSWHCNAGMHLNNKCPAIPTASGRKTKYHHALCQQGPKVSLFESLGSKQHRWALGYIHYLFLPLKTKDLCLKHNSARTLHCSLISDSLKKMAASKMSQIYY